MSTFFLERNDEMVYVKSIKKMIIVSLLSLCIMTNTVYSDVHAASVVIGGVVLTAGEAFALLMATLGISATVSVTYQNREALQAWGNKQLDSFCSWMAETDDIVWSAQQDVEQWALTVIDGGLSTGSDMWKKFKQWAKSLYIRNSSGDYNPTENAYLLESVSQIVGVPFYVGLPPSSCTVYYPTAYNDLMSKYDSYVIVTKDTGTRGFRIAEVFAGISQIKVSSNRGVYISYSAGCQPSVSDVITGSAGLGTSNGYWQESYTGVFVSSNLVFEFDASFGLNPVYTGDNLPSEEKEYVLNPTVANALETADNPDDIDIIGIGSQVGAQTYPLNLPSAEALPNTLSDLATGALTLEEFNKALGLALANLSSSTLITEDPNDEKPISDVTTEVPVDMQNFIVDGLAELFPFCLPFDFIDFINVLCAEPQAPKIDFPIRYPTGISSWNTYMIEVDLSVFDGVAEIMRDVECLLFIIGLALITRSYMIRG